MATLSSLLLGASSSKDTDLDALFQRTKTDTPPVLKRAKLVDDTPEVTPPEKVIAAAQFAKSRTLSKAREGKKRLVKNATKTTMHIANNGSLEIDTEEPLAVKQAKRHAKFILENFGNSKGKEKAFQAGQQDLDSGEELTNSEEEQELVHETTLRARKSLRAQPGLQKQPKAKEQIDESPADKDVRTTFLGNVPLTCVVKKIARKALIKHLISSLPMEKQALIRLDSIRFRSLPLAAPVPAASGTKQPAASSKETDIANVDSRNRKRARQWREHGLGNEDEDGLDATKSSGGNGTKQKFLTASQKRKVAYIHGQMHEKASNCNAYAVWTTNKPEEASASQLAALIVKYANNTTFEGLTLRVDSIRPSSSQLVVNNITGTAEQVVDLQRKKQVAVEQKKKVEEEKRTLYLGSLDFEEKEQAVRDLCEGLMQKEKGHPPPVVTEVDSASPTWVERVRIVKDPETGLGKGFAYVIFNDRQCVDEMLTLEATRVKLSKRKLRLERCKSSINAAAMKKLAANKATSPVDNTKIKRRNVEQRKRLLSQDDGTIKTISIRRADEGEALRALPKSDRKAIKAADEDRLKRRLEKKSRTREAIRAEKAKELIDKKVKKTAITKSARPGVGKKNEGIRKKGRRVRSDAMENKKNSKKIVQT